MPAKFSDSQSEKRVCFGLPKKRAFEGSAGEEGETKMAMVYGSKGREAVIPCGKMAEVPCPSFLLRRANGWPLENGPIETPEWLKWEA